MDGVIQKQRKHELEDVRTSVRTSWLTGSCPTTKYKELNQFPFPIWLTLEMEHNQTHL